MAKSITAFARRDQSRSDLRTSAITGKRAPLPDVQIKAAYAIMSQATFSYLTRDPHHLALVRRQIGEAPGNEGDLPPPPSS